MGLIASAPARNAPLIEVRDDADPAAWDAYVEGNARASVYHLSTWAGVIRDVFGHRTRYLSAISDGRIVGVLPLVCFRNPLFGRFVASMPFVNYGGVAAESQTAAAALLAAAITETRAAGASWLELRRDRRWFEDLPVKTHKVAMVLPFAESAEAQWLRLDRKVRNQVRKAEKSNLVVRAGGAERIRDFYSVFAENMRDLGTPVQSRYFFERVTSALPRHTGALCVYLDGTPVAASFVVWHRNQLQVPWASSLRRHNHLCPNVLLYWEMVKFGLSRGLTSFDLGRSTPHEGTYQFKKQWGAEPRPLYWEYWLADGTAMPDRSPKNTNFSRAIDLWRRLPVAVTRAAGPLIIRHIP